MDHDRLGRRRQPGQDRGLQPMHPVLPPDWASKAFRVAMSEDDWQRLESLICRVAGDEPTRARAYGAALSYLLNVEAQERGEASPLDWLDYERRKALQTLRLARPGA